MNFILSKRVEELSESATLRMAQAARELKQKGADIINLSLGEPDFDTPEEIKQAAIEALKNGQTKYTPVAGTLELRQAIVEKLKNENHLEYSANQIVVSNGAKQAFANICQAILNPGDEALILGPYWVSYFEIIKLAEGIPVVVNSKVENNYKFAIQDVANVLNEKTKLLVFSSPCNPTGTVYTQTELEALANLLNQYPKVVVAADEIYEHIIFGQKHFSFARIPGMKERTVTINGFSKAFAMTGWRLGYMAAPMQIAEACTKIQGQFTSGANSIAQSAGITALKLNPTVVQSMCDQFEKRRDTLLQHIKTIPHWVSSFPEGAFYLLPEVDYYFGKQTNQAEVIKDAEDLAYYLLKEAHVALVSGDAFGAKKCLRISYSLSESKIIEAVERIKMALSKLT